MAEEPTPEADRFGDLPKHRVAETNDLEAAWMVVDRIHGAEISRNRNSRQRSNCWYLACWDCRP